MLFLQAKYDIAQAKKKEGLLPVKQTKVPPQSLPNGMRHDSLLLLNGNFNHPQNNIYLGSRTNPGYTNGVTHIPSAF